jgi:hypothetical protein
MNGDASPNRGKDFYTGDLGQKKLWYSAAAEAYNSVRPKYPADVIDYAVQAAQLTAHSRLLEIGCGPGTATIAFASRGFPMVCVELLSQHPNAQKTQLLTEDMVLDQCWGFREAKTMDRSASSRICSLR